MIAYIVRKKTDGMLAKFFAFFKKAKRAFLAILFPDYSTLLWPLKTRGRT